MVVSTTQPHSGNPLDIQDDNHPDDDSAEHNDNTRWSSVAPASAFNQDPSGFKGDGLGHDEKAGHKIGESATSSAPFPPERVDVGSRQTACVSVPAAAAAPYGNNLCCDLEKSICHDSDVRTSSSNSSSFKSTTSALGEVPANNQTTTSHGSTDAYGNSYPEGGLRAWLCVLGSFSGLMVALGMMNTIGTYHAYLTTHQLRSQSESDIGWIFGVYAFLSFFTSIQIGPIFDAYGPRYLILAGSVLLMTSQLVLGVCESYWHFVVVFGIIGGLGTSLVFSPAISAIGHFFLLKRGQATGLATAGGSMGGVIFPLTMQALLPQIGFAWSTRVIALINLLLLFLANLFIRSRLPAKPENLNALLPDFRIFRDPVFAITTAAVFFIEWGLFCPLTYLSSYAFSHGATEAFSYQLLAILNAGSCFGRYLPGLIADKIGRFNTMILTLLLCLLSTLALWLPAANSIPLMVLYALIFGFASGSSISLTPVCIGQLCKMENYGRYFATCSTLVSFGSLTGIPIAGGILQASQGGKDYWGLILFTGLSWVAGTVLFVVARGMGGGWKLRKAY